MVSTVTSGRFANSAIVIALMDEDEEEKGDLVEQVKFDQCNTVDL